MLPYFGTGCSSGAPNESDGAEAPAPDLLLLDASGLPDCANSISEASFCDGWASRSDRSDVAGGNHVPDWLWNARDAAATWLSTTFQGANQFLCADDADAATAMLQSVFPQDPEFVSGVDESDSRWFDVRFDDTGTSHKNFRVPRCAVFSSVANVGSLWPTSMDEARTIDPIWELSSPPGDRIGFFDMARMIDVYRYVDSDASYDTSVLWEVGSYADGASWIFRTCRLDGRSTYISDGSYRTAIWQSDYTMDIAAGRASFRGEDVRGVTCDHWLGSDPPL